MPGLQHEMNLAPPPIERPPRAPGTQRPHPHIQGLPGELRAARAHATPSLELAQVQERGYPSLRGADGSDRTGEARPISGATSPTLVVSLPSSSASTRTPSPGSLGAASSRRWSGAEMQVAPPVRWKWQPRDADRQLRDRGEGAAHLRGRRANLARIREIQGLSRQNSS
eukprot:s529_g28.t1